jgi:hypothetical protein
MVTRDFSEFVTRQQPKEPEAKLNWAEVRDEWLENLESLHTRVAGFLKEYIDQGSISYGFSSISLVEDNIGKYAAKQMDIKIGRQRVSLIPIGTLLIGSKGRVDIVGSTGKALLLLLDEKAKKPADLIKVKVTVGRVSTPSTTARGPISWAWKIVTSGPQRKFVDLEKGAFLSLLMEIANA